MESQPLAGDLREFLRLLASNDVEHLVVGGYAVGLHGFPRNTGDLDVWVRPTAENARRVVQALRAFGFPSGDSEIATLTTPGKIVRLGYPPVRIELLTAPSGVEFEPCSQRAVTLQLGDINVPTIGLEDLLANKRAAARPKDLIDVAELERLHRRS